jgi:hypothetical protein
MARSRRGCRRRCEPVAATSRSGSGSIDTKKACPTQRAYWSMARGPTQPRLHWSMAQSTPRRFPAPRHTTGPAVRLSFHLQTSRANICSRHKKAPPVRCFQNPRPQNRPKPGLEKNARPPRNVQNARRRAPTQGEEPPPQRLQWPADAAPSRPNKPTPPWPLGKRRSAKW